MRKNIILDIESMGQVLQPLYFGFTLIAAADDYQPELSLPFQAGDSHKQPVYSLERLNTAHK